MSTVSVTQELFSKMDYDTQNKDLKSSSTSGSSEPTVLIVFANSDINAALYHLTKSLESPFEAKAIATVLVQESIKQDFVQKLQQQLKPYPAGLVNNNENFLKALAASKELNAKVITKEPQEDGLYSPILVFDFTHEQLTASSEPSGIVTLHTFRTAKEAIALVNKESLKFSSVSVWHENHSYAYELVATLKSADFFINCYQVPLNVLKENATQSKNCVILDKKYHYETLQHEGVQKSIVFPVGSIFAN